MTGADLAIVATLEPFYGQTLRDVHEAYRNFGNDRQWLVAVALKFEQNTVILSANNDRASIDVEVVQSLDTWTGGTWDSTTLQWRAAEAFPSTLVGLALTDAWECNTMPKHTDAVDLALQDLLLPSIKILNTNSQLVLMSIHPR